MYWKLDCLAHLGHRPDGRSESGGPSFGSGIGSPRGPSTDLVLPNTVFSYECIEKCKPSRRPHAGSCILMRVRRLPPLALKPIGISATTTGQNASTTQRAVNLGHGARYTLAQRCSRRQRQQHRQQRWLVYQQRDLGSPPQHLAHQFSRPCRAAGQRRLKAMQASPRQ